MKKKNHLFSFYSAVELLDNNFVLNKDEALFHRIFIILRMKKDDSFFLFDSSFIYKVNIVIVEKNKAVCTVVDKKKIVSEKKKITAYIPLLEREYMNQAIYGLAQQGINTIQFVSTYFQHVGSYSEKDINRFEKIMIAACEQGKQYTLPKLEKKIITMEEMLSTNEIVYVFSEFGMPLQESIKINSDKTISFFCGPEAGFSEKEELLLRNTSQCQLVKLSNFILRSCDVISFAAIFFRSI